MMLRTTMVLGTIAAMLVGCTRESRTLVADQPQTSPEGAGDPRAGRYEGNYYQVSQGGRYFSWYGCVGCHGPTARGALDLADGQWLHGETIEAIYASIAAHPADLPRYGERIPVEQMWQISAFVRDLAKNDPARNRRAAFDQDGEPQGATWQGPVR